MGVQAIREMVRCTAPGGRVILIDPVWPRHGWLRPLAWLIMKLDRGEWVRTEAELAALAEEACPGEWSMRRYLLSYHATEGAILTMTCESRSEARRAELASPTDLHDTLGPVGVRRFSPQSHREHGAAVGRNQPAKACPLVG